MRKHELGDLAPASFLSLRLAQPTTSEPSQYLRAIDLGAQSVKLRFARIVAGGQPTQRSRGHMRASASATSLERLPWPKTPALTQFHSEPRPGERHAVKIPDMGKPFFAKRTEPTR